MTTEIIEGEVREVDPQPVRALVVAQPGQAIVSRERPEDMIATASKLAAALKDIVDHQKLYSVINGKKFPQVEAWMTIGRLDNVVAREAERPIRNDDGSYEGFVELVRLSDGMVIGRASALCGTPDDAPWGGSPATEWKKAQPPRSEPARRAMAVTRATSRAFRQQYSWIMALAGYEATPAEEMPRDEEPPPDKTEITTGETLRSLGPIERAGAVAKGSGRHSDLEWRQTPDGYHIGFLLEVGDGKAKPQVSIEGSLAVALFAATGNAPMLGMRITVKGELWEIKAPQRRTFYRIVVKEPATDWVQTDEWRIPAETETPIDEERLPEPPPDVPLVGERPEAETAPLFDGVA